MLAATVRCVNVQLGGVETVVRTAATRTTFVVQKVSGTMVEVLINEVGVKVSIAGSRAIVIVRRWTTLRMMMEQVVVCGIFEI